ncbi:MAG: hypothetical protein ABIH68_08735 [bacterium]
MFPVLFKNHSLIAHGFASGDALVRGLALGSLRVWVKLLAHTAPLAKTAR